MGATLRAFSKGGEAGGPPLSGLTSLASPESGVPHPLRFLRRVGGRKIRFQGSRVSKLQANVPGEAGPWNPTRQLASHSDFW